MNRDVLYHASTIRGLKIIETKRTSSKDKYVGDYVFATPDKRMASMYLSPKEGGTILINTYGGEPYAVIQNNETDFKKVDKGGSIYELPADNFIDTPQKELKGTELVSLQPITPLSEQIFRTSLDAMQEMGVKVYFVEGRLFEDIQNAKGRGLDVLSKLKPYN